MPQRDRPRLTARLRPGHWVALDVAAAALLAAVDVASVRGGTVGVLTVLGMTVPLAVRRFQPVPVFCVVLVFSAVAPMFDVSRDAHLARAFALYPLLLSAPQWLSAAAVLAAFLVTVLASLAAAGFRVAEAAGSVFNGTLILTTVVAVGFAVRLQRRYVGSQREQAAERAVAQERLRIARELHDVLAHGMSVIAIQAGVARHVFEVRPEEARRALEAIEEGSRSGLTELRRMLVALRTEDAGPDLDPAPSLADLGALVTRTAAAGVPVEVREEGERRPLPPGMELSAYRIVQEALTNVVRHAGPARAEVLLRYRPDGLTVEVGDDGAGPGPESVSGHGLLGMRERVAVFGGRFSSGPHRPPRTGFRIHAELPFGEGPG